MIISKKTDRIVKRRNDVNILNQKTGITLVPLVVSIIILLILAGVTLVIFDGFFVDKIATVSNKTEESFLKEKIEMAFMEIKAAYWNEREKISVSESEYFLQELKKSLESSPDIEEVITSGNVEESIVIRFKYYHQNYQFQISKNGEVNLMTTLFGNAKIGDYVEYPVEYIDVYSQKHFTATNGWRVIDDGVMEGTSGFVRIISTGVPVKWYYEKKIYATSQQAIDSLMNHFEDNILLNELVEKIDAHIFKVDNMASKVNILTLPEFNNICNILYKTNRALDDTSDIEDEYKLFNLDTTQPFFYWLATEEENTDRICYISNHGIFYNDNVRMGIRPVIYLENNLNYKLENDVWKIID